MDYKFIYVFDSKTKQELLNVGFILLVDNSGKSIFVFKLDNNLSFALQGLSYVLSNTLVF